MVHSNATIEQPSTISEYVLLDNEAYFKIADSHKMADFFMSLVGSSDHWMFISSTGALTCGRQDPESAMFPYASDDKISVAQSNTGPTTLLRIEGERDVFWEPFTALYHSDDLIRRNLYKTPLGNKLVFEEINESLNLVFRYRWASSEKFGFVRSCHLENIGSQSRQIEFIDGLRNILPHGVSSEFMMRFSNLANAYKKSELVEESGIGLYYLSSIPTDKAEPSEGLKATTVWQTGLSPSAVLISEQQLFDFRNGRTLESEYDVRGKSGAYLINQRIELSPGESMQWHIVAEVSQDHADVIGLNDWIFNTDSHAKSLVEDIESGQQDFLRILSSSDAIQCSSNERRCNRHLSNTVFNVMRGGLPLGNYAFQPDDFRQHVEQFNRELLDRHNEFFCKIPDRIDSNQLIETIDRINDPDLTRLALEYLPLAFSRRHGDPTRPWNHFSINLRSDGGQTNLNYQGNWRDIFQNWEALSISFPHFTTAMIGRFVNATTADGYNPYRVTKDGFEWEEPSPEDPWANIGYWGDHQIIYLLKLLERDRANDPQRLSELLNSPIFVHANIPYRIKPFEQIKEDPQDTIEFDADRAIEIAEQVAKIGADGKLLRNRNHKIHRVTLIEKLLTLSLAKLSNFVPDGGIWLNTQRPEWNDANNALVGNGLSMVTACYLYRWFRFLHDWILQQPHDAFRVSHEVVKFLQSIVSVLDEFSDSVGKSISPAVRSQIVDKLSKAGCHYRQQLYDMGFNGELVDLSRIDCLAFFELAAKHLESTIHSNRRSDRLYHAYNLIDWRDEGIAIEHLYEMLEGQVAVLSSGLLPTNEAVQLLDALRASSLYREGQDSYVLYPNRQLPRFLSKNNLESEQVDSSPLLSQLLKDGNDAILRRDVTGGLHFNGEFRNAADLKSALAALPQEYQELVGEESSTIAGMFEDLFGHRHFTGRSGTFFAYEGLGSIYWHMVSKLLLATAENFFQAVEIEDDESTIESLREHFHAIRRGIGAEKSPEEYGAFPSDPYSHTPENAGVKQPGMTGQVKEDILTRFLELGIHVENGCIRFRFDLLDHNELARQSNEFDFYNLDGDLETIIVPTDALAFTLCQVPVLLQQSDSTGVCITLADGSEQSSDELAISAENTSKLFSRSGEIRSITCRFKTAQVAL